MTTTEVTTAYAEITGVSKSISTLNSEIYALQTSTMQGVNSSMSTKANELLGIGMNYWLGGSARSEDGLWFVNNYGNVYGYVVNPSGVRPVISLNSGVQIAADNTGTGASEAAAYTLAD